MAKLNVSEMKQCNPLIGDAEEGWAMMQFTTDVATVLNAFDSPLAPQDSNPRLTVLGGLIMKTEPVIANRKPAQFKRRKT